MVHHLWPFFQSCSREGGLRKQGFRPLPRASAVVDTGDQQLEEAPGERGSMELSSDYPEGGKPSDLRGFGTDHCQLLKPSLFQEQGWSPAVAHIPAAHHTPPQRAHHQGTKKLSPGPADSAHSLKHLCD